MKKDSILVFPKDKQDEIKVVVKFLENEGIDCELSISNIVVENEEPIDIYVKDIDKKFQVVCGDSLSSEKIGRAMQDDMGIKATPLLRVTPEYIKEEYIYKPLENKSKYGQAASGIILLIYCPGALSFLEPYIKNIDAQKLIFANRLRLRNFGFDKIYWVCSRKNFTKEIKFD